MLGFILQDYYRPRLLNLFLFGSIWIASSVATTDNHRNEGFGAGIGREKGEHFRVQFIAKRVPGGLRKQPGFEEVHMTNTFSLHNVLAFAIVSSSCHFHARDL